MNGSKVTIIGCGLIGGSIALSLKRRRRGWSIACLDLPSRLPAIREAGVADEVATLDDAAKHVPGSSIVLVATPVQNILDVLAGIAPFLTRGTVVTDVGSVKGKIMAGAGKLVPTGVHFIGGHPMAGSEHSGVESADPLLFSERVYVLCPYPDTPPEALLLMMDMVESLLALPITIEAEEHDRIMAMVSHLPQLISVALMHAAQSGDAAHGMLDKLAGRGFRDMTRLAASDFALWKGILEANRAAVVECVDRFSRSLAQLGPSSGGPSELVWEQAAECRRRIGSDVSSRPRKPDLRSVIDRCDKHILGLIARRMEAARKIGRLKMSQTAPVSDPDRERRMMAQRSEWGRSLDLPPDLIAELFGMVIRHSTRLQQKSEPQT